MGTAIAAFALFSFVGVESASAHGYLENPQSRGLLCKEGANQDCGGVVWEPQSLEAPKGFPGPSIPDGQIASVFYGYGIGLFGQLGFFVGTCIAIVFFVLQVLVSKWWLSRFVIGPVEWFFRAVTYMIMPKFKK